MSLQKETKRIKAGQSITDFKNQAIHAVNTIKGIISNLESIKSSFSDDEDFVPADQNEVQDVIDAIRAEVNRI